MEKFTAMTLNIRCSYSSNQDGVNCWAKRRGHIAEIIGSACPDFIGMQEVVSHQLSELQQMLENYQFIGTQLKDGSNKEEHVPIALLRDYKIIAEGHFWLSEEGLPPGSKGWDADYERVCIWCVAERQPGKNMLLLNTHFDHKGVQARLESAKLLLAKLEELQELYGDMPIVVCGDFNASPEEEPIQILAYSEPPALNDCWQLAAEHSGPAWTFHGFGALPEEQRERIDFIFVKNIGSVIRQVAISDHFGEVYPSDHTPVLAEILL